MNVFRKKRKVYSIDKRIAEYYNQNQQNK